MTSTRSTRSRSVLVVRKGLLHPKRGAAVSVDDVPLLIGRNPDCRIVIGDPEVSAAHCEVSATADGVLLRDLGSRNGTFIAGARVREAWLTAACTIQIGGSTLAFEPLGREHADLAAADRFGPLIGQSPAMRRIFRILGELAATDVSVLVSGETGTGKDLAARALHQASERASGPFAVLDCGSIPPSLAEAALFGHERGAFTGAVERTDGVFREANRGTLFLDEIGELPLDVQPKLLRALAERKVKRVGGKAYESVDVRFVAATHKDLGRCVNAGAFREDLFFRLALAPVLLPPLRERREDIPLIARAACERLGKGERADDIVKLLEEDLGQRQWKGNVRELVQMVELAAKLPPGAESLEIVLGAEDDERTGGAPAGAFGQAKRAAIEAFESDYFSKLFAACKGNVSEMARVSGLERHKVRHFLKKHGLRRDP